MVYGDQVKQLTYLLFLASAHEQAMPGFLAATTFMKTAVTSFLLAIALSSGVPIAFPLSTGCDVRCQLFADAAVGLAAGNPLGLSGSIFHQPTQV
jgi:hypothetical protein